MNHVFAGGLLNHRDRPPQPILPGRLGQQNMGYPAV